MHRREHATPVAGFERKKHHCSGVFYRKRRGVIKFAEGYAPERQTLENKCPKRSCLSKASFAKPTQQDEPRRSRQFSKRLLNSDLFFCLCIGENTRPRSRALFITSFPFFEVVHTNHKLNSSDICYFLHNFHYNVHQNKNTGNKPIILLYV